MPYIEPEELEAHRQKLLGVLNDDDKMALRMYAKTIGLDKLLENYAESIGWTGITRRVAKAQMESGAISCDPGLVLKAIYGALDAYADELYDPEIDDIRTR